MELLANGFSVIKRVNLSNGEGIVLAENKGREEFATWMEADNNTFCESKRQEIHVLDYGDYHELNGTFD